MQEKPSLKRIKRTTTMRPHVGVGVIVTRCNQELLLRRVPAPDDGTWSVPGGHLEYGESLEACAIREVKEEVGVTITDLAFRAVTNDLFEAERKHYVTIWMEVSFPHFCGEENLRVYYSRGRSRIMQKVQKTYTQEFKREAVRLTQTSGKPIAQVAKLSASAQTHQIQ